MNRRNKKGILGLGILKSDTQEYAEPQEIEGTAFEYKHETSRLWVYGEGYKVKMVEVRMEALKKTYSMNTKPDRTYMSFDGLVKIDIDEDGVAVVRKK